LVDGSDVPDSSVADGEFVEPCCQGMVLLQLADPAVKRVTSLVPLGVEHRWPPTGRTLPLPIGGLLVLNGIVTVIARRRR
jgi:hypothetical protein